MRNAEFMIILYVADQQLSRDFYAQVLQTEPVPDVPGMTEFSLMQGLKLGLMPENGIARILGDKTLHSATGNGIPRCELYLLDENPDELFTRALDSGAIEVSKIQQRDWGHLVGYVADRDGHIIAFAKE